MITCPNCNHQFVSSKRGSGASVAKNWKELPPKCKVILDLWKNNDDLKNKAFTKDELYEQLTSIGLNMKIDPFYARTSELLGFGSIRVASDEELMVDGDDIITKKKLHYKLNNKSVGLDALI